MTFIDRNNDSHTVNQGVPEHLCCFYQTEDEHQATVTTFLRQGITRNEKLVYILDSHNKTTILGYLQQAGLDPESLVKQGQVTFLTADDTYLRTKVFDPNQMIEYLYAKTGDALREGYSGLRVTGEMTWGLRGLKNSDRLLEYEAQATTFFPAKCIALCQYDQRRFDSAIAIDIAALHPVICIKGHTVFNLISRTTADVMLSLIHEGL